ncbi:hypothetical protein D3C73_461630 [compost metagenome]
MADRFVQQHAGPAGTQHHRQRTGRRRDRFKIDQRLTQCFTGITHGTVFSEEITVIGAAATAMTAALTATVLLDDHTDIETHQRPHIRRQATIGGGHQNPLPDPGHAHGDLLDTRIKRTGRRIDALEQIDFLGTAQHLQRIVRRVELRDILRGERLHGAVLPGAGDRPGGAGRCAQGLQSDRVAVGETGFLTRLRTHAHTLVEVEAAFLDDAVFQRPGLGNLPLEIQVGGIDARAGQVAEHTLQAFDRYAAGRQEVFTD